MTDRDKIIETMARELRAFKEPGYGSTLLTVLAAWVEEEFPSPREAAMAENSAWDTITKIADLALTAYESHLQASGMAVVPVEPSEAMHDAARDWSRAKYGKPIGIDASKGCWAAMLSASPSFNPVVQEKKDE